MSEIVFNEDGSAVVNIAPEYAESFKTFKTDGDISQFIKSANEKVALPGENAAPEEWAAFNKLLGVPEKPEDYKFEFKDENQKNLFSKALKELHQAGITQKQAENLIKTWTEETAARQAEINQKYELSEKELSAEWKEQKETNKAAALKAAALLGFNKESLSAMEQILGPKEVWLRFYDMSLKMKDTALKGGSAAAPNYDNPQEATKKIAELMTNPEFRQKLANKDPEAKKLWDQLNKASIGV